MPQIYISSFDPNVLMQKFGTSSLMLSSFLVSIYSSRIEVTFNWMVFHSYMLYYFVWSFDLFVWENTYKVKN